MKKTAYFNQVVFIVMTSLLYYMGYFIYSRPLKWLTINYNSLWWNEVATRGCKLEVIVSGTIIGISIFAPAIAFLIQDSAKSYKIFRTLILIMILLSISLFLLYPSVDPLYEHQDEDAVFLCIYYEIYRLASLLLIYIVLVVMKKRLIKNFAFSAQISSEHIDEEIQKNEDIVQEGAEIKTDSVVADVNIEYMYCRKCGFKIPTDSKFCSNCGEEVKKLD